MKLRSGLVHAEAVLDARGTAGLIVAAVRASPGLPVRGLLHRVRSGKHRFYGVLEDLVGRGLVLEARVRGARRFFPPDFDDPLLQLQCVALLDPRLQQLLAWVSSGTRTQSTLFEQAKAQGWGRSTTRDWLRQLEEAGLVRRAGGTRRYPAWKTIELNKRLRPHYAYNHIG